MSDCKYAIQLVDNKNQYHGEQVTNLFTEPLTLQEIIERVHDGELPAFCRQVDAGRYEGLPDDLEETPYRWFTDVVDVRALSGYEGALGDRIVVGRDRVLKQFVSLHVSPLPFTVGNVLPYLEYAYRLSGTDKFKLVPVDK
jgi:hypothetical protein